VESFRIDDPDIPAEEKELARAHARRYLELAVSYAKALDLPMLIVMCGLIGSGKSTLAASLASRLDAIVLRSDLVRKELAGLSPKERRFVGFEEGIYGRKMTEKTYGVLLEKARKILEAGRTVILDASFLRKDYRKQALKLAASVGVEAWCCWCRCPQELLRKRLRERLAKEEGPSDAREALLEPMVESFQPPNEWPKESLILVDTQEPLAQCTTAVLERLGHRSQIPRKGLVEEKP
jgi:hypothetical protein